jgi:hypothetical protein
MDFNQELILRCLQIEDTDQKISRLAKFSPVDWGRLLVQAEQHALDPIIAWQIKSLGLEALPPEEIRQVFRQSLLISTGNNLVLFNELGKVLRQFKQAGIPVIVLKGAHLAAIVYEHIGQRSMEDIDLLVHSGHIQESSQILTKLGYQSKGISSDPLDTHFVKHHLPDFSKPDFKPIEIHWTIGNPNSPFRIEPGDVWRDAQTESIAGIQTLVLAPHDLIVYLCMHSYAHNYEQGLRPFVDLLQVIRHYQGSVQWDKVKQRAKQWKATRCVFLMFCISNQLFGSPPEAVLNLFLPLELNLQWVDSLSNRIISQPPYAPVMKNKPKPKQIPPSLYFIKFLGNLNFIERLSLFWKRIFLPPQTIAKLYQIEPQWPGLFFYYLQRIWDLLRNYGRLSFQTITRRDSIETFASPETALAEWIAKE